MVTMIALKYGLGKVTLELPGEWKVEEIPFRPYPALPEPEAAIRKALQEPIGSPPLRAIVRPGERVCILVNDSTRQARSELFLPLILEELNQAGVRDQDVLLVIATGSHRQATPEDVRALVGPEVAGRVAIYSHDARDQGLLTYLGATSRGTPVYVNSLVLKADRRLLTGSVVHHWFAGFGGGKKALVPGVAGDETIRRNHALMLDPASRTGVLDGNPAAEDMLEAARLVGGRFPAQHGAGSGGADLGGLCRVHGAGPPGGLSPGAQGFCWLPDSAGRPGHRLLRRLAQGHQRLPGPEGPGECRPGIAARGCNHPGSRVPGRGRLGKVLGVGAEVSHPASTGAGYPGEL
jgi:hypothetical protein